jgi:hypothetical protein
MTARFKPTSFATDHEIRTRIAQGHVVHRVSANEVIVRVEQRHNGTRLSQKVTEIEWPGGPQSAELIGASMDGSVLWVDLGAAKSKGMLVADRIEELPPQYPAERPRVKRTGRRLAWWASRIVWRNAEPPWLAKETKA